MQVDWIPVSSLTTTETMLNSLTIAVVFCLWFATISAYTIKMPDVYVLVEEKLELDCTMIPTPEPFQGNISIEMTVDGTDIGKVLSTSSISHTMTKVLDSDQVKSGEFVCTFSDSASVLIHAAKYGVREVPGAPLNVAMSNCNPDQFTVQVSWTPGANIDHVTNFSIEAKTNFDDTYTLFDVAAASETTKILSLSGWATYRFRVVANNEAASSAPSEVNGQCITISSVPDSNPENVTSLGNRKGYLIIQWNVMPRIQQNGEGFYYVVGYKKATQGPPQTTITVDDWTVTQHTIETRDTFTPYQVTVGAKNNLGPCPQDPQVHTLYSGEDDPVVTIPLVEVGRLRFVNKYTASAEFIWKWSSQLEATQRINGVFQGFNIEHWLPDSYDPDSYRKDVPIDKNEMKTVEECGNPAGFYHVVVNNLDVGERYKAKMTVRNTYYKGPPTEVIFKTGNSAILNLQTDCCERLQTSVIVTWEMYKDTINPEGIQGRLLAFKVHASHHGISNVDKSVPIANITREETSEGLVKFTTSVGDLELDETITIQISAVRERCNWEASTETNIKTFSVVDAAPSSRANIIGVMTLSLLILRCVIGMDL